MVAIPVTVDNDLALTDRCLGFDTAVQEAQRAIRVRAPTFECRCFTFYCACVFVCEHPSSCVACCACMLVSRLRQSAKTEAKCAPNGIGIVKLFGWSAGFIAAFSTLASSDVDVCLVPEVSVCLCSNVDDVDVVA